jgi:hypothetical protein
MAWTAGAERQKLTDQQQRAKDFIIDRSVSVGRDLRGYRPTVQVVSAAATHEAYRDERGDNGDGWRLADNTLGGNNSSTYRDERGDSGDGRQMADNTLGGNNSRRRRRRYYGHFTTD